MTHIPDATIGLAELVEESRTYDGDKHDYRIPATNLFFDDEFRLVVDAEPLPAIDSYFTPNPDNAHKALLSMTENALAQIGAKLGPVHFGRGSTKTLPQDFLDGFDNGDRAQVMNWILGKAKDLTWLVRGYQDDCRAVLAGYYPRVWNTRLMEVVRDTLAEQNNLANSKLVSPFVTPDSMGIKIMWPDLGPAGDGKGGHLRVGVLIRNGETGNDKLELLPMAQDGRCNNSIITDSKRVSEGSGMSIIHYEGVNAGSLMTQFMAHLPGVMRASGTLINKMIEAEAINLNDFRRVIDGLAIEFGWQSHRDFAELVDTGSRQSGRTVGGVVSGLTYAAQHMPDLEPAARIALEIKGGNYLYAPASEFARLAKQGEQGKRIRSAVAV